MTPGLAVRRRPPPPATTPYEDARDAMRAAVQAKRYDVAQQIADKTAVGLCVICVDALAEGKADMGNQEVDACIGCVDWAALRI